MRTDDATPPQATLADLTQVLRSKNAGPTLLTLDLFFKDAVGYARAAASPALSATAVAALYQVAPAQVQRHVLPTLLAIKYALPRRFVAGTPGDGDVYGAQQHAPLLGIVP